MTKIEFKIGELVRCSIFRFMPNEEGKIEPQFSTHHGEILDILPDGRYEVWGPGGEQSQKVTVDCLSKIR